MNFDLVEEKLIQPALAQIGLAGSTTTEIIEQGNIRDDMFALGIPTEHTNWFTQVGSGKPGARSAFTRDARLIAEASLDRLFGAAIPRNMTRFIGAIGAGD